MREPIVGDMVITLGNDIGLVMDIDDVKRSARVMFVNNGPWIKYKLDRLRRATSREVEVSRLRGVGCNQASDDVKMTTGEK